MYRSVVLLTSGITSDIYAHTKSQWLARGATQKYRIGHILPGELPCILLCRPQLLRIGRACLAMLQMHATPEGLAAVAQYGAPLRQDRICFALQRLVFGRYTHA